MSGTYQHQTAYRKQLFSEPVPQGQKRCRRCLKVKIEDDFKNSSPRNPNGISRHCHECRDYITKYMQEDRSRLTPEQAEARRVRGKEVRDATRKRVLDAYGGKCACCGTAYPEHLTIDHIVKIGSIKRKENGEWGGRFYLSLIKRGFPEGYRCLCWSCNWSFGCYGYCPHQKELNEQTVDSSQ